VWFILATFLFAVTGMIDAAEKPIALGAVENVIILPWGVKLPARIDTGAARSSLDAQELKIEGNMADFKMPERYGGTKIRLPIVDWRHVRTNQGLKRRPVVELELCIGPKRLHTWVALDDRSGVKYPLLVGRNTLKGNFTVDVKRTYLSTPKCETPLPLNTEVGGK
jgi:hypothetical protein